MCRYKRAMLWWWEERILWAKHSILLPESENFSLYTLNCVLISSSRLILTGTVIVSSTRLALTGIVMVSSIQNQLWRTPCSSVKLPLPSLQSIVHTILKVQYRNQHRLALLVLYSFMKPWCQAMPVSVNHLGKGRRKRNGSYAHLKIVFSETCINLTWLIKLLLLRARGNETTEVTDTNQSSWRYLEASVCARVKFQSIPVYQCLHNLQSPVLKPSDLSL